MLLLRLKGRDEAEKFYRLNTRMGWKCAVIGDITHHWYIFSSFCYDDKNLVVYVKDEKDELIASMKRGGYLE